MNLDDQYVVTDDESTMERARTTDSDDTEKDFKMSETLKNIIVTGCCFYLMAAICSTICYKCCFQEYNQEKEK